MLRKLVKNYHIEAFRDGRFEELPEEVLAELQRREAEKQKQDADKIELEDHE